MDQDMDFSTYLVSKKIDERAFEAGEPDLFNELKAYFAQVHPDSFTTQKLFLINPIRRRYQLQEDHAVEAPKKKTTFKPKIN